MDELDVVLFGVPLILDSPLLDAEDSPGVWLQPEKETARQADSGKSKILKILFFIIFSESPFCLNQNTTGVPGLSIAVSG